MLLINGTPEEITDFVSKMRKQHNEETAKKENARNIANVASWMCANADLSKYTPFMYDSNQCALFDWK